MNASDDRIAPDPREAAARLEHGHALARLGQWAEAAGRYREALGLAPGSVAAMLHLADALGRLGEAAEALALLRAATEAAPQQGGAWLALGAALRRGGEGEAAVEAYRHAVFLAPKEPAARLGMGLALADLDRLEEAVVWLNQAAETGHVPSFAALGTALMNLGEPGAALHWFRTALRAGDRSAVARLGEGLALLTLGELRAGWEGYEARPVAAPFRAAVGATRWDGRQEVRGRTVLVWAEQGLGDSIMFARYLKLLRERGARVVLAVQEPLMALLAGLADDAVGEGASVTFDLHCPLPSLPRGFGTALGSVPADVPYLAADPALAAQWRRHLGPGLNLGLVWAGNPDHGRDRNRSLPFAAVAPLLGWAGATWHVLQKRLEAAEAEALASMAGVRVPGPGFNDFADTAACIDGLDLVVTADTSVAHLAGAMGKRVWIMLEQGADFRWMRGRDDSPWYPTARLFRQARRGDWGGVVAGVLAALPQVRPEG